MYFEIFKGKFYFTIRFIYKIKCVSFVIGIFSLFFYKYEGIPKLKLLLLFSVNKALNYYLKFLREWVLCI